MMNVCNFMGRLTRDPELRRTANGVAVTSFTIAVDRDFTGESGERQADFIDLVAWRQTGEFIARNFKKGSPIAVVARFEPRRWTDKEGNNRVSAEFNVSNAYFCGSKNNNAASGNGGGYGASAGQNGYTAPAPQAGSYAAPAPQNGGYAAPNGQAGGYGAPAPAYNAPAPAGYVAPAAFGGYAAPAANDFTALNDEDAQLPF